MSLADLQSWLVDHGIEEELDQLTRHTVRGEIGNLLPETSDVAPPVDWQRLLLAASVLARSDTRFHQEAALRIATSAVTMSRSAAVVDAGAVLLGKLSNFRAVALAAKRALLADDLDGRLAGR